MYTIQANSKGTRSLQVSDEHLKTIQEYDLFNHLADSTGIIDEEVLEKLRQTVRSLIIQSDTSCKPLLDLCIDVIYHNDMKAYGLRELNKLYQEWCQQHGEQREESIDENS